MATIDSLKKLFRYEVVNDRPIGKGGCGSVWEAEDLLLGRKVATKTIDEPLLWDHAEVAERTFRKEAIAAARLSERCRYIVRVHDIGRIDGVLFLVMEWIAPGAQGRIDVSPLIGNITLAAGKSLLFQVAEAVATAHAHGIVHSDISPWNIVHDATSGVFKLADFGLLKIIESLLLSRGSGSLLKGGRLCFLPLEAKLDIARVGYSADVYALAVTLRVLLEGESCLRAVVPTPPVLRLGKEQRDAPDQLRQLLSRFIDGHQESDTVAEFVSALQRVPN